MKDEEMAEEYAEKYFGKKTELVEVWKLKSCKENFLAGLKAGRQQAKELLKRICEWENWEGKDCPKFADIVKDIKQYLNDIKE